MITREQVIEYLDSLNIQELEQIFMEYVEYTENIIMEDRLYSLQNTIENLEDEVNYLRYGKGYYE